MSPLPLPALPAFSGLHLDSLVTNDTAIIITASVAAAKAVCPSCGQSSTRIHSTYLRHPRDLPWGGHPVQLLLHVRRFFCDTPECPRITFAEQVSGLTRPYGQRTVGLNAALQTLGLALGGEAGAVVGRTLGILGSADTILRQVRALTPEPAPPPRVVGIDEWAIRKGQRYGSILVDLERHRPIDLLPEHASEPITKWFEDHPSVEIVARDRASIYTEALAKGAPQAQQVADRWHLTQNVGSALQELLSHHTKALREVARGLTAEHMPPALVPEASAQLPPLRPAGHSVGPIELREHQLAEAKRLRAQGWSYRRIAEELHLNRRTVVRYVQAEQLPRRILPQSTSSVTPYLAYVRERWAAGCQQGTQLLAELQAQGYRGSLSSIYRALKAFRTADGRRLSGDEMVERVAVRSARQAMWLLVGEEQSLSDEDAAYRRELCAYEPTIAKPRHLHSAFSAW